MIISISPEERAVLVQFLSEARQLRLGKKSLTLLAKLRDDFRTNQVNSQRLAHARPLLKMLHTHCMNVIAQTMRYSRIPRWQRLLLLPALATFFIVVLPRRVKFFARLSLVAKCLNDIHARQAVPIVPTIPSQKAEEV